MRVLCVNQDAGIRPERKKGAAIHLRAMRRAFTALDAEVLSLDESDPAALAQRLSEVEADGGAHLVYERYSLGSALAADFAARASIPFVLEMNTPLIEEEARWRTGPVSPGVLEQEARVLASADQVIAVSTQVRDYAIQRGVPQERVSVFANGVDTERFRPRAEHDPLRTELVPQGRFALGFHGRLRGWHGFDRLARLARELLEDGLPLHLVLVGEGDFDEHLEGIDPGHVSQVGWVDHDDVARYVATFDALPLTYPPDAPCYFSPLKLAEAMACGVVPVVPSLGDLEQVVTDGVNGRVYSPRDLPAAGRALRELAASPEPFGRLSAGAVARAEEFSWKRIAAFVLEQTGHRGS